MVEVEADAFFFVRLDGGVVDIEAVQFVERFPISEESAQVGDFLLELMDEGGLLSDGFFEHGLFSQGLAVCFFLELVQSLFVVALLLENFGLKGFEFGGELVFLSFDCFKLFGHVVALVLLLHDELLEKVYFIDVLLLV